MRKFLFWTTFVVPLITMAIILHIVVWMVKMAHAYSVWVMRD